MRLITVIRDAAAVVLARNHPDRAPLVERLLIGLRAHAAEMPRRLRLIPVPSQGAQGLEAVFSKLFLSIPPDCPWSEGEIRGALSGLVVADWVLTPIPLPGTEACPSLWSQQGARHWVSLTPLALPALSSQPRRGYHRTEDSAQAALIQAFRQAGFDPRQYIAGQVRRTPFSGAGPQAEAFAVPPRFPPQRLWYAALTVAEPIQGPLLLGDGRWLGLGVMTPVGQVGRLTLRPAAETLPDAVAYRLLPGCRPPKDQAPAVAAAIRAAVMSLARDATGGVPLLFSGHLAGPGPARLGNHRHIYLAVLDRDGDGLLDEVRLIAPWRVDRSPGVEGADPAADRAVFARVAAQLRIVRAGAQGVLLLAAPKPLPPETSAIWTSLTRYRPTRHPRGKADAASFIADDVRLELTRRGLPPPVDCGVRRIVWQGGVSAHLILSFANPLTGPILIGRDAHQGGGLLCPAPAHGPEHATGQIGAAIE
ncbi:type I-U CRISPR-associated protein Csb2 [Elstera sp.]|uniref:type I-G CRISPR-associated protein Csb2 n=1 Tax=Elstera sp. TaxID=1916664 RepID=UPI0037BF0730